MQNHSGTFRAFFATLAAAAFLALTLSSCAVTVTLPSGGSTTIPQPPNTGTVTGAGGSSTGTEQPTPGKTDEEEPKEEEDSTKGSDGEDENKKDENKDDSETPPPPVPEEPKIENGVLYLPTDRSYKIEARAFAGNTQITKVIIPANVTAIGASAFNGCNRLKSVEFEGENIQIGNAAFKDCLQIEKLILPDGVLAISDEAFSGCAGLKEVHLPQSLVSIGTKAFLGCVALSEINFPSTLSRIDSFAFQGAGLTNVIIPKNVIIIEDNAFEGNQELRTVQLDGDYSVNNLGEKLFSSCTNLAIVNFNGTLLETPIEMFSHCSLLQEVNLPKNLVTVGKGTFSNVGSSWEGIPLVIILPESTRTIAANAFESSSITSLYIPQKIEKINPDAFTCFDVEKLYFGGNKNEWLMVSNQSEDLGLLEQEKIIYPAKPSGITRFTPNLEFLTNLLSVFL